MANVNKTSFAVSVTPKIKMDAVDGVNVAMEVLNENIRKREYLLSIQGAKFFINL